MIINKNIDGGKAFDWGKASADYSKFRDIYPAEFYQRIVDLGLCTKGQRVLDLGTGTGVLPRNMYHFGADFIGVDVSENQIVEAIRLSQESNMNIEYTVSGAEDIDFAPESFDVVTACQCFMYFDRARVLPVVHNVLKENGHFCILLMAWLPYEDDIAKMSEKLVLKYNPAWTGAGATRPDMENPDHDWCMPLFKVKHSVLYDVKIPFTRESWHGRIKACRGIGASSLSEEAIREFEAEHIAMLLNQPVTFNILHFVTILNLQKVG